MDTKFYDDGVTIISLVTIVLGCIITSLKLLFKSKCTSVSICYGLLSVVRNVELETELTEDKIPPSTQV